MVIKMSENAVGTLEEQALKRKERLKSLKRRREGDTDDVQYDQQTVPLPKPKFRSYKPQDEKLSQLAVPTAKPGDVETEIKGHLESATTQVVIDELDITSLAPRKPDWDLKRDVAKKLEKLERRTQKAIAELIRERLKMEQDQLTIQD